MTTLLVSYFSKKGNLRFISFGKYTVANIINLYMMWLNKNNITLGTIIVSDLLSSTINLFKNRKNRGFTNKKYLRIAIN